MASEVCAKAQMVLKVETEWPERWVEALPAVAGTSLGSTSLSIECAGTPAARVSSHGPALRLSMTMCLLVQ